MSLTSNQGFPACCSRVVTFFHVSLSFNLGRTLSKNLSRCQTGVQRWCFSGQNIVFLSGCWVTFAPRACCPGRVWRPRRTSWSWGCRRPPGCCWTPGGLHWHLRPPAGQLVRPYVQLHTLGVEMFMVMEHFWKAWRRAPIDFHKFQFTFYLSCKSPFRFEFTFLGMH